MYDDVRQRLNEAHKKNKRRCDEKVTGSNLTVGDRVWLYVPAVKQGRTKKFSSLWRGPYTIIDRVGAVTYRIQLIGSPKSLVVHRNRLKLCYGELSNRRQPAPPSQRIQRESTNLNSPRKQSDKDSLPPTPKPTYADVVATRPAAVGGYTTSSNEPQTEVMRPLSTCPPPSSNEHSVETARPQRNRQPPARYGNYITH